MICCVREVAWIVDSLERQAQRNPFELSGLFGYEPGGTLGPALRRPVGRIFWAGAEAGRTDWMGGAVSAGQRAATEAAGALR